jgi:hypothetical protein
MLAIRKVTKMSLSFLLAFLATIVTLHPQANCWRGIAPLRSTRADVEKLLDRPVPESKALDAATYKTASERVFILYSTGLCDAKPGNGWNVPPGTVISISVYPNTKPKFADLKLDESKHDKARDPEVLFLTYYTNEEEGTSIEVNTDEGVVNAFRYSPMSEDNHLRCPTSIPKPIR